MSRVDKSVVRHRFIVVVPVADRPQHLQACLNSLRDLCHVFPYPGPISVLIADDSAASDAMTRHRELAAAYTRQGLSAEYFGLAEQQAQLQRLPDRAALKRILGEEAKPHKGASLMRNMAYLRVLELADDDTLVLFIDSDQEFRVCMATEAGDREVYAIDYFHQIDRLFRQTDTQILTGKVVGDPPVSPTVMAGNFLADVLAFLQQMATLDVQRPCRFHGARVSADDAAYHDMANLFGFAPQAVFDYACNLTEPHTQADTLAHFTAQLPRFFYGEHPTRKSYYQPEPEGVLRLTPARTLYTGNYCIRPAALRYFIPFAELRLRMAGPTLGRILKAELGERFVSANLPMLHNRTLESTGASEYRPGVAAVEQHIDLSGEYERQFYGDVLLFTVEKLAGRCADAESAYTATQAEMTERYAAMQAQTMRYLDALESLLVAHVWPDVVVARLQAFLNNMRLNFGPQAAGPRQVIAHASDRKRDILVALSHYADDRAAWETLFA